MTKAIAKSLGLLETATETEILAKVQENATAAAKADALAKMSAIHKAHFEVLKGADADAFVKMDDAARDAAIAKAAPPAAESVEAQIAKGDAFRGEGGVILTKKDFGTEAGFQFAKSSAERITKAEADNKKLKDDAAEAKMKEKAEKGLTLIGKADDVGGILFQIAKHDAALADKVEALLKTANDALAKGALFSEMGRTVVKAGSAADAIQKGAQELLKTEPTLKTIEKARTEFRKRNPEIVKRESEEASAAKKAA